MTFLPPGSALPQASDDSDPAGAFPAGQQHLGEAARLRIRVPAELVGRRPVRGVGHVQSRAPAALLQQPTPVAGTVCACAVSAARLTGTVARAGRGPSATRTSTASPGSANPVLHLKWTDALRLVQHVR
jgi:hypothetical protein